MASKLTDTSGNYRFDNLSAGKYFVQQLPAVGLVLSPGTDVSTVTISSDDFHGTAGIVIDSFEPVRKPLRLSLTGELLCRRSAPEAVGGQRDLLVQLTTPYGSLAMGANTDIRECWISRQVPHPTAFVK